MAIVHITPTILDFNALTVFGAHSKPNSESPIGYFGTGLKYAIAVLVRHGIDVHMVVNKIDYKFTVKSKEFRTAELPVIQMSKRTGINWRNTNLPFTTNLGKNWELWQAFRELHSNTLDEGGQTVETKFLISAPEGNTQIYIDDPRYTEIFHQRDSIFLPEAMDPVTRKRKEGVQIIERPTECIYYRGMKVATFGKAYDGTNIRARYTYNIWSYMELTEDRTLKNIWVAKMTLANLIVSDDTIPEAIVLGVLNHTRVENSFEGQIDWEYVYGISERFKKLMLQAFPKNRPSRITGRIGTLHALLFPPEEEKKEYFLLAHLDKAGGDTTLSSDLRAECRLLAAGIRRELYNVQPPSKTIRAFIDPNNPALQSTDASAAETASATIDDEIPF